MISKLPVLLAVPLFLGAAVPSWSALSYPLNPFPESAPASSASAVRTAWSRKISLPDRAWSDAGDGTGKMARGGFLESGRSASGGGFSDPRHRAPQPAEGDRGRARAADTGQLPAMMRPRFSPVFLHSENQKHGPPSSGARAKILLVSAPEPGGVMVMAGFLSLALLRFRSRAVRPLLPGLS